MTKQELIKELSTEMEVTQVQAEKNLKAFFIVIQKALKANDSISLVGVAKISVKDKPARVARNPKTGESVNVPAKRVASFKFSNSFEV